MAEPKSEVNQENNNPFFFLSLIPVFLAKPFNNFDNKNDNNKVIENGKSSVKRVDSDEVSGKSAKTRGAVKFPRFFGRCHSRQEWKLDYRLSRKKCFALNALQAEMMSIKEGVSLAVDGKVQKLKIFSDSKRAIELINNGESRVCCDDNTNNFTESFNATLGLDRVRPIMTLLEGNSALCSST